MGVGGVTAFKSRVILKATKSFGRIFLYRLAALSCPVDPLQSSYEKWTFLIINKLVMAGL